METNRFIYPRPGFLGATLNWLANSRALASARRAALSRLPYMKLESDVVDVVYLNWVIPTYLAMCAVPAGVRLIEKNGTTIVTVLTYRHGNFGPSFLGPLRKIFPSPLQSNWRLYLLECPAGTQVNRTVLFIKNIFNSAMHSVGSRAFSDVLPSHVAESLKHEKHGSIYITRIEGGSGSAPGFSCITQVAGSKRLPAEFQRFFPSWEEAITQLSLQDSAICAVEGLDRMAQGGIDIPIDTGNIIPLEASEYVAGPYLTSLGAAGKPFCFAVPHVRFRALWERLV
jgi:hypothetical protein